MNDNGAYIKLRDELIILCKERFCLRVKKNNGDFRKNHLFYLLNKKIARIKSTLRFYVVKKVV